MLKQKLNQMPIFMCLLSKVLLFHIFQIVEQRKTSVERAKHLVRGDAAIALGLNICNSCLKNLE